MRLADVHLCHSVSLQGDSVPCSTSKGGFMLALDMCIRKWALGNALVVYCKGAVLLSGGQTQEWLKLHLKIKY